MIRLAGTTASPGFAVGPAWRPRRSNADAAPADASRAVDVPALANQAAAELRAIAESLRASGHAEQARIFDAQALMAADPALVAAWERRVAEGEAAGTAIRGAAAALAADIAAVEDPLIAARAADVRDVGDRLARLVAGEPVDLPAAPSVIVADDLPPSLAAEIPSGLLLGIALAGGSPTAHAAILARGLGIPCLVGVSGLATLLADSAGAAPAEPRQVAIDGATGELLIDPDESALADLAVKRSAAAQAEAAARDGRSAACTTRDGHHVVLLANIGGPDGASRAIELGAEGVGLFRTEFLFMRHETAPTESEQCDAYAAVFRAFGPERPVVVRLADIGGDKPLPYLPLPAEANPFLGVRGLRLAYDDRRLLVDQVRAISRAGAIAAVTPHVMAPMVTTREDVHLLRQIVAEAQASLATDGLSASRRLRVGIMVEVPAAALCAAELAPLVDFFSIGTNDLTQYVMAADRGNASLAALQDALHPAVLRCIAMVVAAGKASRVPVAVCGELAGDPAGALVLVGLGVDELSVDPGSLDRLRALFGRVALPELAELAGLALRAETAAAVRSAAAELVRRSTTPPVAA